MVEVVSGYKKNCFKIMFNRISVANGQFKSQAGKIPTDLYVKRSCKKKEIYMTSDKHNTLPTLCLKKLREIEQVRY